VPQHDHGRKQANRRPSLKRVSIAGAEPRRLPAVKTFQSAAGTNVLLDGAVGTVTSSAWNVEQTTLAR